MTHPNPDTMTAAECADWCARDDGWTFEKGDGFNVADAWWKYTIDEAHGGRTWATRPFPLTRDGAAAAMPPEVVGMQIEWFPTWYGGKVCAKAYRERNWRGFGLWMGVLAPDEITARLRLAVACRLAQKEAAS